VIKQVPTWIVRLAMADVTECLTRWSAEHAENVPVGKRPNVVAFGFGKVAELNLRVRKVRRERRCEDGIDVKGELWAKPRRALTAR
jgi:hypothetical protein